MTEENEESRVVKLNVKRECDIDDLMCQLQVMNYLGGMKNLLGSEKFQAS